MLDSMIAMSDVVTNFWSLGLREGKAPLIMTGFKARDGYFAVQIGREHQFVKLTELIDIRNGCRTSGSRPARGG